ncbi:aminoglycoside phosphotransferase family protein [Yoonia sp. GPGPB17]|uniref:aminoglycoside phosphotransferase family protein n=1 Tax=Yoonia sp. GPGPB17 TaxID=3026147 RepID=UPI0030BC5747
MAFAENAHVSMGERNVQQAKQDMINRAEMVAARWQLTLDASPLKHTADRVVYKVNAADGLAVLKLNRKFGSEGGSIPFLRGLPDGIGVKLLRVSPLRRAMLLSWLEGPTLDMLVARGNEARAERLLAQVASSLSKAKFRRMALIQRLNWRVQKRFDGFAPRLKNTAQSADFARAKSAFDVLVDTMPPEVVIHGDLHFGNIIDTAQGPRFIDPKGYRADPAAEFAAAFSAAQPDPAIAEFKQRITRRAAVYAPAIEADPLRLIRWGAVLYSNKISIDLS